MIACHYQPEEVERYWFAFVLYSVKRLSDEREADNLNGGSGENGFTLCQILRSAKLKYIPVDSLHFFCCLIIGQS